MTGCHFSYRRIHVARLAVFRALLKYRTACSVFCSKLGFRIAVILCRLRLSAIERRVKLCVLRLERREAVVHFCSDRRDFEKLRFVFPS